MINGGRCQITYQRLHLYSNYEETLHWCRKEGGGRTAWEEYNLSSLHCASYRILGSSLPFLLTAAILPRDLESPSISKRQHLVGPAPGESQSSPCGDPCLQYLTIFPAKRFVVPEISPPEGFFVIRSRRYSYSIRPWGNWEAPQSPLLPTI